MPANWVNDWINQKAYLTPPARREGKRYKMRFNYFVFRNNFLFENNDTVKRIYSQYF